MSDQKPVENGGQSAASPLNGVVPPVETRFQVGNPGGPGRPKTRPFREAMEKALKEGRHSLDRVVDDLFSEASKGNVAAIKEVREVMDGKMPQPIAGSDEDPPIRLDLTRLSVDDIKRILAETESTNSE